MVTAQGRLKAAPARDARRRHALRHHGHWAAAKGQQPILREYHRHGSNQPGAALPAVRQRRASWHLCPRHTHSLEGCIPTCLRDHDAASLHVPATTVCSM